MADKGIVWKLKIGSLWVEVTEEKFIIAMYVFCDHVILCDGKIRRAIFVDKYGIVVGMMNSLKEV